MPNQRVNCKCLSGVSSFFPQKVFRGRLTEPFYRLVWRDTHGGAFMIQQEAPFHGTHQEQLDFVATWENIVEEKLASKHPNVSVSPKKTQKNTATLCSIPLQGYVHPVI